MNKYYNEDLQKLIKRGRLRSFVIIGSGNNWYIRTTKKYTNAANFIILDQIFIGDNVGHIYKTRFLELYGGWMNAIEGYIFRFHYFPKEAVNFLRNYYKTELKRIEDEESNKGV